jgi:hypothetical protein
MQPLIAHKNRPKFALHDSSSDVKLYLDFKAKYSPAVKVIGTGGPNPA